MWLLLAWPWQKDIDNERRTPHALVRMKGRITHRGFRTRRAEKDLRSLGLKDGATILDFGCGSGVYTIAAARVVGSTGTVHAVDIHPASLEMVEKRASSLGIKNIETIYSDLETGADDESVDAVLFYDVLRSVKRRKDLLEEAHRILKPDGILLVRQSRMRDDRVKDIVLKDGFFTFMGNHGRSMKFRKIEGSFHEVS